MNNQFYGTFHLGDLSISSELLQYFTTSAFRTLSKVYDGAICKKIVSAKSLIIMFHTVLRFPFQVLRDNVANDRELYNGVPMFQNTTIFHYSRT